MRIPFYPKFFFGGGAVNNIRKHSRSSNMCAPSAVISGVLLGALFCPPLHKAALKPGEERDTNVSGSQERDIMLGV